MRDYRGSYRFWWGDLTEKDHLENLGIDGRMTLKFIFKKWDGEAWTGLTWLRIGKVAGACECIKYREFLD